MAKVLIGMPTYSGQVHFGAAKAFFQPCRPGTALQVELAHHQSSLLAGAFNVLWAVMLNRQDGPDPFDYFAMLHADIAPEDGWLDILLDELDARGLDVLSAAVPIKDPRGLTSTAVERQDPWLPRRLTMAEIAGFPDTFTDADVGGELLLNTGCWICRLGPWAERVRFTIRDTIRRDPRKGGKWQACVQPEDWDFSRQCRAVGLKIAATKRVRVSHFGDTAWCSDDEPYGWDTDHENCDIPIA